MTNKILLAGVAVAALALSGCGKKEEAPAEAPPAAEAAPEAGPAADAMAPADAAAPAADAAAPAADPAAAPPADGATGDDRGGTDPRTRGVSPTGDTTRPQ